MEGLYSICNMKNLQYPKLSFFESVYIWIYIYTIKYKFLSGRGPAEGPPGVYLAFFQFCNFEVIWRSIIMIFHLNITYSKWVDVGILACLIIFNVIFYERRLDSIAERHNALPEKKRLGNRTRMFIYVAVSIGTVIGLMFYVSGVNDAKKAEQAKEKREILRIIRPE